MNEAINTIFGPPLHAIFDPINSVVISIYMPWARIVTVAFFVAVMIWAFRLRKEYLQMDAPSNAIWADLRVWTVVSMLPHVFIYLFLGGGGE